MTTMQHTAQTSLTPSAVETDRTTMSSATLVEPGRFAIIQTPLPSPAELQVRVRLEGCGVCASNIPPFEGREWFKFPMEPGGLGHEGWGVVDAVGDNVTRVRPGDRVALLSYHAYAEYDLADQSAVVPLPPALNGLAFPGEPLGCAMNIFNRAQIRAGQTVAIVGIGFLGALLTQLVKHAGASVIAVARRPWALDIARQCGAAQTVTMDDHYRIIEQVKTLTDGQLCDVVIECVGQEWPLNLAAELTRQRGRLVVAGYHQDGLRSVNMQLWNWRGIDVINAHERDSSVYVDGIRRAADAVAAGRLDPAMLYTHEFPLKKIGEALQLSIDRPDGFIKSLIMFGRETKPCAY